MNCNEIVSNLKSMANPLNVAGMARFGISSDNTLGISMPVLRKMAKNIGKNHDLALQLWDSSIHEARMLAGFIAESKKVDNVLMEKWVKDFDSWDVCDQVCSNLFDKTTLAYQKISEWVLREEEYVKRAGFVLMACLAVHDKKADDTKFLGMLDIIVKHNSDSRNFVKKAVNWALRQIGKRNIFLHKQALETAIKIKDLNSSARWIAVDAIRELSDEKTIARIRKKSRDVAE